ncbi:MAG TPA: sodium-translocating pyrophosphatase [Syntrophales bacterium]|nr:sodium-translocating pyrophosphatase [Syntrophales bacterium]HOU76979.1 sodium-translocating pyrophosphatase [Syntrophales bacterium]HPC32259.1 sodium-translocating pyrophosphatase [Syntrophales bacterium]HQI35396.1 sodium-translocating pyrophosphatase [Syntrophales bacterium]HRR46902.1 sodium-translocating pyrophosphatase [Syntrophales bacterium]
MMFKGKRVVFSLLTAMAVMLFLMVPMAFAGEADIKLPDLTQVTFVGGALSGMLILNLGLAICVVGMIFGWMQYTQTKNLPAHQAMLDVSQTIWETCKTYVLQQGKFLTALWILIAICIVYYFGGLSHMPMGEIMVVLVCSILGILGSYGVAWFGIRINTVANSRAAFASLSGDPLSIVNICLRSGMSVGLLLVSIELFFMIIILAYIPKELSGPCFIGFAIGESLGASALRICGGIFTKIADIGSDLMKIIFHLPEDDPKNPGVIADCTGDNAGDSVGPTADGFETYGVTGVALIAFLALALADNPAMGGKLIVWIFAMRILMILTSLVSYFANDAMSKSLFGGKKDFNFEHPLTNLVWITSIVSIIVTFAASYVLLADVPQVGGISLWLALAIIISCGTIAGALIPEFTKVFTSTGSRHCEEVVNASRQGGPSLNILSGFVAGNFSAFWEGLVILTLMLIAYLVSQAPSVMEIMPPAFKFAAPVFAFGLVAFGFLGMGPVTIAVDSFGPVSDNAQSIYELSMIESRPDAAEVVKKHFGVTPDFEQSKHFLESGDGAGNTFKATAKPVLIGTAVVGATTMVFGIIILLEKMFGQVIAKLSLVQPEIILGLIMGGCVIYWFTGASTQAVVTGAYRAVVYIKENINLDKAEASIEDSKEVVKICTIYAQKGMINIFIVIFFMALGLAFFNPYFFIGYLIGIAFFGLFQAIFMANAGGCWDNGKKIVEVDLKQKNTPLHEATVVGDTVGDPFKDTSSVSMNPVIKFTTLFGLLATEIAVTMTNTGMKLGLASLFFVIALIFVYRSFYSMRISAEKLG